MRKFFFFTFNRFKSNKLLHCVWHKREAISVAISNVNYCGCKRWKVLDFFWRNKWWALLNLWLSIYWLLWLLLEKWINHNVMLGNWIVCKLLDASILLMMNVFRLLLCWILYWNVKFPILCLRHFLRLTHTWVYLWANNNFYGRKDCLTCQVILIVKDIGGVNVRLSSRLAITHFPKRQLCQLVDFFFVYQ